MGVNKTFGIATLDLGYIAYDYPGVDSNNKAANNAEYYTKLTIAPEKQPYTFGIAYYQDDTGGVKATAGNKADRNYYEANATYNFGPVQSLVSYGVFDNDTNITTVFFYWSPNSCELLCNILFVKIFLMPVTKAEFVYLNLLTEVQMLWIFLKNWLHCCLNILIIQ